MPSDKKVLESTYEINSLPLGPCVCPPLESQANNVAPKDNNDKFLNFTPFSQWYWEGKGVLSIL